MDWAHTTAPPVARAAKMLMIRTLMRSTSATLETAASPAEETIMMSAMPTMTARNCSIIKGRMSLRRACLLNTGQSSFLFVAVFQYSRSNPGGTRGKTHGIPCHF